MVCLYIFCFCFWRRRKKYYRRVVGLFNYLFSILRAKMCNFGFFLSTERCCTCTLFLHKFIRFPGTKSTTEPFEIFVSGLRWGIVASIFFTQVGNNQDVKKGLRQAGGSGAFLFQQEEVGLLLFVVINRKIGIQN